MVEQEHRPVKEGRLEEATRNLGQTRTKLVGVCKQLNKKVVNILGTTPEALGEPEGEEKKSDSRIGELEIEVTLLRVIASNLGEVAQSLESL